MTTIRTRPTAPTARPTAPTAHAAARTSAPPATEPALGRVRRGGIVALALLLIGVFAAPAMPSLVTAWTSTELDGAHRMHLLAQGSHGLVLGVLAASLLRDRWRRPAAVQLLVVNVALALAIALPAGLIPGPEAAVPPVLVMGALIALLPDRRSLLTFRPSAPLLALAVAGAIGLAMYAADQLHLQHVLPHTEPHAAVHHWAGMALFAATLAVVAVVTALRPVGWRLGLWVAGGVTALFGLVSAADPAMPSSLGLAWGAVAVAGSVAFVAVGERIARR